MNPVFISNEFICNIEQSQQSNTPFVCSRSRFGCEIKNRLSHSLLFLFAIAIVATMRLCLQQQVNQVVIVVCARLMASNIQCQFIYCPYSIIGINKANIMYERGTFPKIVGPLICNFFVSVSKLKQKKIHYLDRSILYRKILIQFGIKKR